MGVIKLSLPDDLEATFRAEISKAYPYKRGAMSKAGIIAIRLWIARAKGMDITKFLEKPPKKTNTPKKTPMKEPKAPYGPKKGKPSGVNSKQLQEELYGDGHSDQLTYCRDCENFKPCMKEGKVRKRRGLACDEFSPE